MQIQLQVYNVKYREAREEHPPLRWTGTPARDALSEDASLGTVVYLDVVADRCIPSKSPSSEGARRLCPRPTSGYIIIQHSVRLDNGSTKANMHVLFPVTVIVLSTFALPVNFNDILSLVKRQATSRGMKFEYERSRLGRCYQRLGGGFVWSYSV